MHAARLQDPVGAAPSGTTAPNHAHDCDAVDEEVIRDVHIANDALSWLRACTDDGGQLEERARDEENCVRKRAGGLVGRHAAGFGQVPHDAVY